MALELQGISKSVEGRVHIQPTTLTLEKGTMNVLFGPTLAGKTTLMRLMAGRADPRKSHVGLTFIRESTLQHQSFTDRAPKLGGLIDFYLSPARVQWSPTGTNIPDYPKLAQLWWQNIGDAMSGAKTPQEALDSRCAEQEKVLIRLEKSGVQGELGPTMNEEQDPQVWLDAPGAPVAKVENEKPQGETISYHELIKSWNS